jgi:ribosomal-protein-alanine N-acetyltransferase
MQLTINENFVLRPFTEDDALSVAKYANNKKIADNLRDAFPYPYTLNDARQFIDMVCADAPVKVFAMVYAKEVVGSIGVFPGQDIHRVSAEIGYWLGEPFWNKGLTSLAVQKIIPYAFERFQLARLFAKPLVANTASQTVLRKVGFTLEATLKNAIIKNNVVQDELIFSLLKNNVQ